MIEIEDFKGLIVVIDKNSDILQLFEMLLGDEGYEVKLFNQVQDDSVVNFIVENQPEVIIMDVPLNTEKAGAEIIERVLQNSCIAQIPIIFTPTNLECLGTVQTLTNQASRIKVVQKPFDIDYFSSLVKHAIVERHSN